MMDAAAAAAAEESVSKREPLVVAVE